MSPSSSKKIQTGGGKTVKLKVKTIKTENPDEAEYAKTHAQIVRKPSGGYELLLPTKINEELKPFMGRDFDVDVVEEGEALKVILTSDKQSANESPK